MLKGGYSTAAMTYTVGTEYLVWVIYWLSDPRSRRYSNVMFFNTVLPKDWSVSVKTTGSWPTASCMTPSASQGACLTSTTLDAILQTLPIDTLEYQEEYYVLTDGDKAVSA